MKRVTGKKNKTILCWEKKSTKEYLRIKKVESILKSIRSKEKLLESYFFPYAMWQEGVKTSVTFGIYLKTDD